MAIARSRWNDMKIFFFLNTVSTSFPGLALFDEKGAVLSQADFVEKNEYLAEALCGFFKKNKLAANDLSAVLVIKGPGSFSGSRAGIVAANALEFLAGVPVLGAVAGNLDFSGILRDNLGKLKRLKKGKRADVFYQYPPNITVKKNGQAKGLV